MKIVQLSALLLSVEVAADHNAAETSNQSDTTVEVQSPDESNMAQDDNALTPCPNSSPPVDIVDDTETIKETRSMIIDDAVDDDMDPKAPCPPTSIEDEAPLVEPNLEDTGATIVAKAPCPTPKVHDTLAAAVELPAGNHVYATTNLSATSNAEQLTIGVVLVMATMISLMTSF